MRIKFTLLIVLILQGLILIFPKPSLADTISHGSSFTISGSGFGARIVQRDIFDNASNTSVSTLWNDATAFSYTTSVNGVALPHAHATKYAYGAPSGTSNAWLSTYVTGLSYPTNLFVMAYRRMDPNWVFGPGCDGVDVENDNNFKWFTVSAGGSWFAHPYWYHDFTDQKCSPSASWANNFYSSGALGNLHTAWTGYQGGSSDSANDPWYQWIKQEWRIGLGSSGQILKYLTNNTYYQNLTGQNTFDAGGADGAFSIGTYGRQIENKSYLSDVVMVVGPDAYKRVILANSATYTSATITEYQPIVLWADGSITINGNLGAIPAGNAWLHVFTDGTDTPSSTIVVSVGSGGGDTTAPSAPAGLSVI